MSINHIVTPLDSAILDSKEQYVFYHKMVDFAFKELVMAVQNEHICEGLEVQLFKQYCDLLLYSVEAMRVKYMYDHEDNMKVDLTDSGFPNYLPIDTLKEEFLDTLLRKKQPVSKSKLFQASSIVYYTSVNKQFIFNRFVQGKILKAPEGVDADFLISWSFYDVSHNRPFICFMYFNYDGKDIKDYRDAIYEVLKVVADRDMALDTMAYTIDRKLPKVFPKFIKRIDLGPLHNVFAKDEHAVTHTILESIGKKEIPLESYAFSLRVNQVTSKSEFKEGSFFSKQTLQKWDDVYKQKYVLAPHRIIQLLYNKTPDMINALAKPPIETMGARVSC